MHTLAGWSEYNPVFQQINLQLEGAAHVPLPDADEWTQSFLHSRLSVSSVDLYSIATNLLISFPYAHLEQQLTDYTFSTDNAEDLRFTRKFLLIARDGLILTVPDITDSHYDALFELTRQLGAVADGEKLKHKKLIKKIGALSVMDFNLPKLHSDEMLFSLLADGAINSLPVLTGTVASDTEQYHHKRKEFRRVVHVAMAYAAAEPSESSALLAKQGIVLNRYFGEIKDSLYGASARS